MRTQLDDLNHELRQINRTLRYTNNIPDILLNNLLNRKDLISSIIFNIQ